MIRLSFHPEKHMSVFRNWEPRERGGGFNISCRVEVPHKDLIVLVCMFAETLKHKKYVYIYICTERNGRS